MNPIEGMGVTQPIDERLLDALAAADEALDNFEPTSDSEAWDLLASRLELVSRMIPEAVSLQHERELAGELPVLIDRYEVLSELGSGGFGIVFRAYDPVLKRSVALKVPRPELLLTSSFRARFLREARAAGALDHPSLVPIYDAGEVGGVCYIASACCEGPDLAAWLKRRSTPVSAVDAARIALVIADAVEHAHQRGILHRDIKPSNVLMFPEKGADFEGHVPRLGDFSLAQIADEQPQKTISNGIPLGSPPYMAPEQALGKQKLISAATDVYAIGALLYEVLTGKPPFQGDSPMETLQQVIEQDAPRPRLLRPNIPLDLETIVLCCLRKQPVHRYTSARALHADLRRFLEGKPVLARRASLWERARSAAKRNPGAAAAVILGFLLASLAGGATLIALGWLQWHNLELSKQRNVADHFNYASQLQLSARSIASGQIGHAQLILKDAGIASDGTNLREFTWRYLQSLSRRNGRLVGQLEAEARHGCLSSNGRLFAVSDSDRGLVLFDLSEDRTLWSTHFKNTAIEATHASSIAFSEDGQTMAVGWLEDLRPSHKFTSFLELRRVSDGEVILGPIVFEKARLLQMAFVDGGRTLLVHEAPPAGSAASRIIAWQINQQGGQFHLERKHSLEGVRAVTFSPDGRSFAALPKDGCLTVYRAASLSPQARCQDAPDSVETAIEFSAGGAWVGLRDRSRQRIQVWNTVTGECVQSVSESVNSDQRIALRESDGALAFVDEHQAVWFQLPGTVTRRQILAASQDAVHATVSRLDFTDDGQGLLLQRGAYLKPRIIEARSLTNGEVLAESPVMLRSHVYAWKLRSIAGEPPGLVYAQGRSVWLWNWREPTRFEKELAHKGEAWSIAFSRDGRWIATGGDDAQDQHTLRIWDARDGTLVRAWKPHDATITRVSFSPDGSRLCTSSLSADEPLGVWDVQTGASLAWLAWDDQEGVRSIAWSPDGRWIAAGGTTGRIKTWRTDNFHESWRLNAHLDRVQALSFSPDSSLLATGSDLGDVRLWHSNSGTPAGTFQRYGSLFDLAFRPDGRMLATAGQQGAITLLDPNSCKVIRTIHCDDPELHAVVFSPDGRTLASGGVLQSVHLWDPESGQELGTLDGHGHRVNGLAFSPDGLTLGSCDHGGAIRLWRVQR